MLALPLGVFLIVFCTGAGLSSVIAPRLSLDAQAAIAAPLGAAVFACASPLLHAGLPVGSLVAAVVVTFGCLTLVVATRVLSMLRSAAVPLVVAAAALALTSAPALVNGGWDAAAIDNADPYVWVSEAKSMLDGPPAGPSSTFPDRVPYERIGDLRSPVAVPFGVAAIAWERAPTLSTSTGHSRGPYYASGSRHLLLRPCDLGVTKLLGSVAALAVVANAFVFYSTFNGWQAQIALALFGTLAIFWSEACARRGLSSIRAAAGGHLRQCDGRDVPGRGSAVRDPARCDVGRLGGPAARRRLASLGRRRRGILCRRDGDRARPDPAVALSASRLADQPVPTGWAAYAHGLPRGGARSHSEGGDRGTPRLCVERHRAHAHARDGAVRSARRTSRKPWRCPALDRCGVPRCDRAPAVARAEPVRLDEVGRLRRRRF